QAAAATRPDPMRIFHLDTSFHQSYVEAGAGPRLLALHNAIKPQAERYVRLYTSALVDEIAQSVVEHERIIEEIDTGGAEGARRRRRQPTRAEADRDRRTEQIPTGDDLPLEQRVLDVMPELNDQRGHPPVARPAREAGQEEPYPRQHDHGVAIVQHFGVHQPGEPLSQHPARLVDRPVERVHLERLDEMLRQVREHDDHEDSEGALV